MRSPEKGFIVRNLILLYRRLIPRFEVVTSRSHGSNFTITLRLPFNEEIYLVRKIKRIFKNSNFDNNRKKSDEEKGW